jgi:hypothetical protein
MFGIASLTWFSMANQASNLISIEITPASAMTNTFEFQVQKTINCLGVSGRNHENETFRVNQPPRAGNFSDFVM